MLTVSYLKGEQLEEPLQEVGVEMKPNQIKLFLLLNPVSNSLSFWFWVSFMTDKI